jgi:hypothetical protein
VTTPGANKVPQQWNPMFEPAFLRGDAGTALARRYKGIDPQTLRARQRNSGS